MFMVKNRNGISWSRYQRPIILPNTERFVGEEVKPQKKQEVTTAKCDLSPPSLTSTTQLRVWIFTLHPQSGIWKRTCTCQINWITTRDGPQSTGRWQTSKISLIPHRSTPCCCTHLISGTWIICARCLHTHTPCPRIQKTQPEKILFLCNRDHDWRWQRQSGLFQRLHLEEKLSNINLKLWFLGIPKPAQRSALRPATLICTFLNTNPNLSNIKWVRQILLPKKQTSGDLPGIFFNYCFFKLKYQ